MYPTALICSVDLEAAPVLRLMDSPERSDLGRIVAWRGSISGELVILVVGGMGKVNAAHAATLLFERCEPGRLIGFGVAGAYPRAGSAVGSIAIATAEIYGDEGVDGPKGWLSAEAIGIPLVVTRSGRFFNRLPVDTTAVSKAVEALERAGRKPIIGPFVTVSNCSGRFDTGQDLAARHDAICETMEGAAYAHIAALYEVPFLEVRGISNLVEDRDLERWDLALAAEESARAVAAILRS